MNRDSLARPMSMEVDKVKAEDWHDEQRQEDMWDHDCGHGHDARECPTRKGKSEGEQAK